MSAPNGRCDNSMEQKTASRPSTRSDPGEV
jgi:hypothetical protein